jgi:hypothetical protein
LLAYFPQRARQEFDRSFYKTHLAFCLSLFLLTRSPTSQAEQHVEPTKAREAPQFVKGHKIMAVELQSFFGMDALS